MKNGKILHRVDEEKIILRKIQRRETNWIGHILRRDCLREHIIKGEVGGKIEVTGRRGTRRKQLLDDFKEKRGYWKLSGLSGELALGKAVGLS